MICTFQWAFFLLCNFSQFGFVNYMNDYIVCAEGVRRYLCAQYHVHNIPVGTRRTKDLVEEIKLRCPELRLFYTDEYQVPKYHKMLCVCEREGGRWQQFKENLFICYHYLNLNSISEYVSFIFHQDYQFNQIFLLMQFSEEYICALTCLYSYIQIELFILINVLD